MDQSSVDARLNWLFQQFPSYQVMGSKAFKPTLDNSHKILEYLGHPEKDLKFIHVAGSNGKGSVSSYLASILTESGLRVGLFTSPHIVHFSERIRVNGHPIPEDLVVSFVDTVRSAPLSFSPSFFEITFGMALQYFQQEACDICIIETGLGGRLDATNVISPELSIITSISLEHTDMLGDTLEAIAGEKAGIIKSHTPVVLGWGCRNVYSVFEAYAKNFASETHKTGATTPFDDYFKASYQKENFACVVKAIEVLPYSVSSGQIAQGIKNVTKNSGYYGRLQIIEENPTLIFDVAHNPDGIQSTFDVILPEVTGELFLIYGSSKDKDIKKNISVFPEEMHVLATEFSNIRSFKKDDLQDAFDRTNFKSICYFNDATIALNHAKDLASSNDTIVVLGSFFLLSDFF